MPPIIVFDLDGTLTDPALGVTRCVQFALRGIGIEAPEAGALTWMIGPPMNESFVRLVGAERAAEAIGTYRQRYGEIGLYENEVYPGIEALLTELREAGHTLYVATSKVAVFADRIMQHFDLMRFFVKVYGSELDGTNAVKTDLLAHLIRQVQIEPDSAIMIGDRCFDIEAARAVGMPVIAVGWGYGSAAEFTEAAPDAIAATPADVAGLVRNLGRPAIPR